MNPLINIYEHYRTEQNKEQTEEEIQNFINENYEFIKDDLDNFKEIIINNLNNLFIRLNTITKEYKKSEWFKFIVLYFGILERSELMFQVNWLLEFEYKNKYSTHKRIFNQYLNSALIHYYQIFYYVKKLERFQEHTERYETFKRLFKTFSFKPIQDQIFEYSYLLDNYDIIFREGLRINAFKSQLIKNSVLGLDNSYTFD